MSLVRYSTDPLRLDLPAFVQDGTTVNRRAEVTDFDHNQTLKLFTLDLLLSYYSVLPDGGFGPELSDTFLRKPDQLQATMLRLVDSSGQILAERYKGATATDAQWATKLAEVEADESVKVYYQYELFREWCDNPIVINDLLRGFILQAYASPGDE